jgi:hypothetical protein
MVNSTDQNPYWEANRSSASQYIACITWKPKFHYRFQKRLPPVPILSQINPVPRWLFHVHSLVKCFATLQVFKVRSFQYLAQPPSWRSSREKISNSSSQYICKKRKSVKSTKPCFGGGGGCYQLFLDFCFARGGLDSDIREKRGTTAF